MVSNKDNKTKKWLSFLLSGTLLASSIVPAPVAFAAEKNPTVLDISKASVVLSEKGATGITSNDEVVNSKNPDGYVITGTSNKNTVKIESGTLDVTFKDLDLSLSKEGVSSPIKLEGTSNVNLTLEGEKKIVNGNEETKKLAAINVPSTATLNISGTGTLNAETGTKDFKVDAEGAAIGGNGNSASSGEEAGSINIKGGNVFANTYNDASEYEVAIGGGVGAGAAAGSKIALPKEGNAWVEVNSIGDVIHESGVLLEDGTGTVKGNMALNKDLLIENGKTLTIADKSKLTLNNNLTLDESGTLVLEGDGTIDGSGKFVAHKSATITAETLTDKDLVFPSEIVILDKATFPELKDLKLKRGLVDLKTTAYDGGSVTYEKVEEKAKSVPVAGAALEEGKYKVTFKNSDELKPLSKEFTVKYKETDKAASVSTSDFSKKVELTAPEGFLISLDKEKYTDKVTYDETTSKEGNKVTYYLKNKETSEISKKEASLKVDTVAPVISSIKTEKDATGKIKVTVESEDTLSGILNYYVLPYEESTVKKETLGTLTEAEYIKANGTKSETKDITVALTKANTKYYLLVVTEDKAGNLSLVNNENTVTTDKAALDGTVEIVGNPLVADVLTANTDITSLENPGTITYKWFRVKGNVTAPIENDGKEYKVTKDDIGYGIKVVISAENAENNASLASAATKEVKAATVLDASLPSMKYETPAEGKVSIGMTAENKANTKLAFYNLFDYLEAQNFEAATYEAKVKTALEAGKVVTPKVEIKEATLKDAEKLAFEEKFDELREAGNKNLLAFMDIDVNATIEESKDVVSMTDLHENYIELTAKVPETTKENLVYGVLALHDGKVSVVDSTFDKETKKISFKADKFSNFAVFAYETANFKVVNKEIKDQVYTGSEIKPVLEIVDNENKPIEINETNFDITYKNNIEIGNKAEVTIKGKGTYSGEITLSFNIVAPKVASIDKIEKQPYTGSKIKPEVVVRNQAGDIIDTKLYEVSYDKNTMPGTATVTVKGINGLEGDATLSFEIEKPAFTELTDLKDALYTGKKVDPKFTIKDTFGQTLKEDIDYKKVIVNNTKVGTGYIFVMGIGAYTGSMAVGEFDIVSKVPVTISSRNVKTKSDFGLMKVTFSKVAVPTKNVTYRVAYKRVDAKDKWHYVNTKTNQVTLRKLAKNGKYAVKVRALYLDGKKEVAGNYSKEIYRYTNRNGLKKGGMIAPKLNTVNIKNKSAYLTAKKINYKTAPKVVNYKFSYRKVGTKTWKYVDSKTNQITIKNLKKGKYVFGTSYSYKSLVDGKTIVRSNYSYLTKEVK